MKRAVWDEVTLTPEHSAQNTGCSFKVVGVCAHAQCANSERSTQRDKLIVLSGIPDKDLCSVMGLRVRNTPYCVVLCCVHCVWVRYAARVCVCYTSGSSFIFIFFNFESFAILFEIDVAHGGPATEHSVNGLRAGEIQRCSENRMHAECRWLHVCAEVHYMHASKRAFIYMLRTKPSSVVSFADWLHACMAHTLHRSSVATLCSWSLLETGGRLRLTRAIARPKTPITSELWILYLCEFGCRWSCGRRIDVSLLSLYYVGVVLCTDKSSSSRGNGRRSARFSSFLLFVRRGLVRNMRARAHTLNTIPYFCRWCEWCQACRRPDDVVDINNNIHNNNNIKPDTSLVTNIDIDGRNFILFVQVDDDQFVWAHELTHAADMPQRQLYLLFNFRAKNGIKIRLSYAIYCGFGCRRRTNQSK